MKTNINILLLLGILLLPGLSFAEPVSLKDSSEMKSAIKYSLQKYKLSSDLIYDLMKHESNHTPNVISIFGYPHDKHVKNNIKDACSFFKKHLLEKNISCKKNWIHLFPETYNELAAIEYYFKKEDSLNYDVGLMQINKANIKSLNLSLSSLLIDYKLNIDTGIKILGQCYRAMNNNTKKAVECYNKGTNENKFGKYNYYAAVVNIKRNRLELLDNN